MLQVRRNLDCIVFKDVDSDAVSLAERLKERVVVRYENEMKLHIRTKMVADNEVLVEITDLHDNISKIVVDGKELLNTQETVASKKDAVRSITLNDISPAYIELPHEDVLKIVEDAITYNLQISEKGMDVEGNFGRTLGKDVNAYEGGIDERMSGELMPVMTVAGSGHLRYCLYSTCCTGRSVFWY